MAMTLNFQDNDPWHLGMDGWTDRPCGWIGKVEDQPKTRTTAIIQSKQTNGSKRKTTKRAGSHHNRTSKGGIPQPNPFIEHLLATPVATVLRFHSKLRVFLATDTIKDALRLLNDSKGLYAPVVHISEKDKKVRFFGFVCAFDVMGFLIDRFSSMPAWDPETVKRYGDKFLNYPVAHIIHYSRKNRVNDGPQVLKDSPLFQTLSIFQKRVLRIAVRNAEGQVVNILDRLDVIRYLVHLMVTGKFKSFFSKTLLELELGRERVIKINHNEPVWRAFATIHKEGIDTLAVVDDNGVLQGSFDAGQVRGHLIQRNPFAALRLPIKKYLKYNGIRCPILTCNIQTPISYVLLKLLSIKNGLIGMFFVDHEQKPKGLVTLTSLMRALVTHKQPDRRQL